MEEDEPTEKKEEEIDDTVLVNLSQINKKWIILFKIELVLVLITIITWIISSHEPNECSKTFTINSSSMFAMTIFCTYFAFYSMLLFDTKSVSVFTFLKLQVAMGIGDIIIVFSFIMITMENNTNPNIFFLVSSCVLASIWLIIRIIFIVIYDINTHLMGLLLVTFSILFIIPTDIKYLNNDINIELSGILTISTLIIWFIISPLIPKQLEYTMSNPYTSYIQYNIRPKSFNFQYVSWLVYHRTIVCKFIHLITILFDFLLWKMLLYDMFGLISIKILFLLSMGQLISFGNIYIVILVIICKIAYIYTSLLLHDTVSHITGTAMLQHICCIILICNGFLRAMSHSIEPIPPPLIKKYFYNLSIINVIKEISKKPSLALAALIGIFAEFTSGFPLRLIHSVIYDAFGSIPFIQTYTEQNEYHSILSKKSAYPLAEQIVSDKNGWIDTIFDEYFIHCKNEKIERSINANIESRTKDIEILETNQNNS